MRYCKYCGMPYDENDTGMVYCYRCGAELNSNDYNQQQATLNNYYAKQKKDRDSRAKFIGIACLIVIGVVVLKLLMLL